MVKSVKPGTGADAWEIEYEDGTVTKVPCGSRWLDGTPVEFPVLVLQRLCAAYANLQGAVKPETSIYNLGLHESMDTEEHTITRVPGGWVYWNIAASNSVFVPYHNEFKH